MVCLSAAHLFADTYHTLLCRIHSFYALVGFNWLIDSFFFKLCIKGTVLFSIVLGLGKFKIKMTDYLARVASCFPRYHLVAISRIRKTTGTCVSFVSHLSLITVSIAWCLLFLKPSSHNLSSIFYLFFLGGGEGKYHQTLNEWIDFMNIFVYL